MAELTNCKECGGALVFKPVQNTLFCAYCNTSYDLDGKRIEEGYAPILPKGISDKLRNVILGLSKIEPKMIPVMHDKAFAAAKAVQWMQSNKLPTDVVDPRVLRATGYYVPKYYLHDKLPFRKPMPAEYVLHIIFDGFDKMTASEKVPFAHTNRYTVCDNIVQFDSKNLQGFNVLDALPFKDAWHQRHIEFQTVAKNLEEHLATNYPDGELEVMLIYVPFWSMNYSLRGEEYLITVNDVDGGTQGTLPKPATPAAPPKKKSWFGF